ncbi:MAG TPA: ABC transporter substrate-binding protein [Bryobacteraceae bacterium]|nr:ABC transporter substrate-binding protein [Bryobacteraceae bacterium]
MTLTRRSLLPALAGSLLAGCHKGRQPLSKIRVAVSPRVTHAPIYLAHEKGLFQKEGLDVELVEYVSPSDTVPALAGNRVEVSCVTFSPGICNAAARGARIRIVATRESIKPGCSDQGALYYRRSRFSQGLEQADAWKGARIALPADSSSAAFYLEQILAANKLSTTAVEISRMRAEDAVAAASGGQVDVFFGSGRPEFLNGGLPKDIRRSDILIDMLGEFQYAYILYGPALLDGDPAVGTSFLRAYLAGVRRYVDGETPQFLDDLAARMHMNPKLVKSECRSNVSTDGEIHTRDLDRWVQWAVASGAVPGWIAAEQLVDTRFQKAASRNL